MVFQPRLEEGALPCVSVTYLMVTNILISLSDKGTLVARGFCPDILVLPDGRGWQAVASCVDGLPRTPALFLGCV